jgi:uncharacterized membrane protein YdjX (TVP38/TMEM64 family)
MTTSKRHLLFISLICFASIVFGVYYFFGHNFGQIQRLIQYAGVWAPIVFIICYILATSFLFPSTPLNLMAGASFGLSMGLLWSSLAAIVAAIVAFAFTRTIGSRFISHRMSAQLQTANAEIKRGGRFYIFAVRLLPVIPHGLINYGAGLSSIRFRDYMFGTVPGTVLGVLPPVLLGSTGLKAIRTGDALPFVLALGLTGLLVAGATWFRQRRTEEL